MSTKKRSSVVGMSEGGAEAGAGAGDERADLFFFRRDLRAVDPSREVTSSFTSKTSSPASCPARLRFLSRRLGPALFSEFKREKSAGFISSMSLESFVRSMICAEAAVIAWKRER